MYLRLLEESEYGIPNIEKSIEDSPLLFIQALALAFKRSDDGEDPIAWFGSLDNKRYLAESGYY
ncbi:MAG: hypothetical protein MI744_07205, partial [Pseudomonadales bacterium]|nr:hypothetical protein [Pseudomonadales bacterium]